MQIRTTSKAVTINYFLLIIQNNKYPGVRGNFTFIYIND